MVSKRKNANKTKSFHQFLLDAEAQSLDRSHRRSARRKARSEIRQEDRLLANALDSVSVGTDAPAVPKLGMPVPPPDTDVNMLPVKRSMRKRKPSKSRRERRQKYRRRLAQRSAMTDN